MKLSDNIATCMRKIMKAKGMEATDFIRIDGDYSKENMKRLTSSRFYDVYNGVNTNPKVDFIDSFCELAGIGTEDFLTTNPDNYILSLTEDEKAIITLLRQLKKEPYGAVHVFKYVKLLLEMQENK